MTPLVLTMMSILLVCVANNFKNALTLHATCRARYRYQQELHLLEGLMTYGVELCQHNRLTLIPWGSKQAAHMTVTLDSWPSRDVVPELGSHSGSLVVTSSQGILTVAATLFRTKKELMRGSFVLRVHNPHDPSMKLVLDSWTTTRG